MADKMRNTPLINQFLLLIMGAMLLYLVVSFARQVSVSHQRHQELRGIEEKIRVAADEHTQLEQELDYVRSAEALEKWARQHGRTRPNEVLVAPVWAGEDSISAAQGISNENADRDSPRNAWWDLFFGRH